MHPDIKASRWRSWAAIITAVAGLIVAVGTVLRPEDHSVTKSSYDELSKGIEKLSDQESKNHDDIVSLRSYVAGLRSESLPPQTIFPPIEAGTPVAHSIVLPMASQASVIASASPAHSLAVAPPVQTFQKYQPPQFDKILMRAGK